MRLGEIIVHAQVRDGRVIVGRGSLPKPDLTIEAGPGIRALMAREIGPDEALKKKVVRVVSGEPKLLKRFAKMFQV